MDERIERFVNLEGYSHSPGWAGFFEKPERFDERLVDEAMDYFFGHFRHELLTSRLVFAYSTAGSVSETTNSYDLNEEGVALLAWLAEKQWVRIAGPQGGLRSMDAADLSSDEVTALVSARMRLGEFIGPCFIVLPESDLIVYPHEDIGFGVICAKETGREAADRFLRQASSRMGFAAYKGYRCAENRYAHDAC